MRPLAAIDPSADDAESWPSSSEASMLLLSLEALARWREHVALTTDDRIELELDAGRVDSEAGSP